MTIFSPEMFTRKYFIARVLNTHPSLLPDFKGHNGVAAALAAGVEMTGCTIHIATAALDDGPILAQEEVKVVPGESETQLHERIKEAERPLYASIVERILGGQLDLDEAWAKWRQLQHQDA